MINEDRRTHVKIDEKKRNKIKIEVDFVAWYQEMDTRDREIISKDSPENCGMVLVVVDYTIFII